MSYSLPLCDLLNVFAIESISRATVGAITLDSRNVVEGSVFFACQGHEVDGRDYVLQAQEAGAIAIIYEAAEARLANELTIDAFAVHGLAEMVGFAASAFYQNPSEELQVFGVTGTNGKTTCCYLLAQALTALGLSAGVIGTLGIGPLDKLKSSGLTTPDPITIQAALAEFRDTGVTQVCMEVSSHALDQGRINGVEFFCTLFTNLSRDHLDYHSDMTAYGLAKRRLFTDFHSELVVTNAVDELGSRLIDVANADFIVQYGKGGDVFADDIELGSRGIKLFIDGGHVEFAVETPLIGKVNIPNIEMLVSTLLGLSASVEEIQQILSRLSPAPGRMELFSVPEKANVVVDYAHTPDALKKALLSVKEHCQGELWCVFGCGGDRDAGKRAMMGQFAANYADRLIITNDNPRSEDQASIAKEVAAGASDSSACQIILERAAAIKYAMHSASENDWILVAGKGHETTQIIGSQVLTFSDREQIAILLGLDSSAFAPASASQTAEVMT